MIIRFKLRTDQEKYDATCRWHPWFAWHPVLVTEGIALFKTIQRRRILVGGHETFFAWEHRLNGDLS